MLGAGGGVLGLLVGSFIGAALLRMPEGRSLVFGRSRCDACGRRLGPGELVPVVSFLVLRGRCRSCKAPIDRWQPAAEACGALVGALPWFFAHNALVAGAAVLMGWQLLLLAMLDLRHMWLPMRLVGALAATGLAIVLALGWLGEIAARITVALIGGSLGWGLLALVAFIYRRSRGQDGMGRGDPPLLGAIGIWLGPLGVVEVLLGASLAGILAAAALMALKRDVRGDTALPLGTCIAAAAWPLFVLQGFG
ncbi:MAG: prepilin peptidase [Sphingomonadales bacterium]|nr:prepilin peptidase [Sphingomonadales bacterium]MDE2568866.1 prepilin peptidase [Sphingomonadales bacterium]